MKSPPLQDKRIGHILN